MKIIILSIFIVLPFLSNCQVIDNNENLNKYFENGIPKLNKSWAFEEYMDAINILIQLHDKKTLPLPSKNNGKEILAKIVDYNDYWFIEDKLIPESERLYYCMDVHKSIGQLYQKYAKNISYNNDKINYGYELISLHKSLIKLTDKLIESADQMVIKNPDMTEIQKDGIKKMKFGLNTFINGTFIIINKEYSYYFDNDICDLSNVFFEFYNKNRNSIDEVSINEFEKVRKAIHENHKLECVQKFSKIE